MTRRFAVATGAIAGLFWLLPLAATFGHRGYAAAMLLAGAAALFAARRPTGAPSGPSHLALVAGAAFSAYLLLSCLWSHIPRAWKVWSDFTFTAGAGVLLASVLSGARDRALDRLSVAFVGGTAAALALLSFEGVTGGVLRAALPPPQPAGHVHDLVSLARGVSAVLPAAFAAIAILLARREAWSRPAAATLALLALLAAAAFDVSANVLALGAGALAFVAALAAPRFVVGLLGAGLVIAALAAPLAAFLPVETLFEAGGRVDPSWAQRLAIWRAGGAAALDCAPLGCGADYARALSQLGRTAVVPGWPEPLPTMPLHPHDVFLQVWMDLGLPGALALAATFACGALALARLRPGPVVAGAAALLAAGAVSALIEASLWQPWRVGAYGFGAAGLALAYAFTRLHLHEAAEAPSVAA